MMGALLPNSDRSYLPLCKPELVGGVGAGALSIGPLRLFAGAGLELLTGFVPVLRIRLPLLSLAFDMPDCAKAEVPQANMQKIYYRSGRR